MGLNLLTGYNGQVSIGHGAFFGLGMYTTAILMQSHDWPFLPTLLVAVRAVVRRRRAVGFPALRVKGLYLALVTLGLAVLFPQLTKRFVPHDLCTTCGTSQVGELRRVEAAAAGVDADVHRRTRPVGLLRDARDRGHRDRRVFLIVRSRFGRALIAVRDHEAAAETVGINIARVKVMAFAPSALYAGMAGRASCSSKRLADARRRSRRSSSRSSSLSRS